MVGQENITQLVVGLDIVLSLVRLPPGIIKDLSCVAAVGGHYGIFAPWEVLTYRTCPPVGLRLLPLEK